jgi:hypothetical protein
MFTENDFNAIWAIYINKTAPKVVKNLKPVVNLLGSVEKHKKLFKESIQEYTKGT